MERFIIEISFCFAIEKQHIYCCLHPFAGFTVCWGNLKQEKVDFSIKGVHFASFMPRRSGKGGFRSNPETVFIRQYEQK